MIHIYPIERKQASLTQQGLFTPQYHQQRHKRLGELLAGIAVVYTKISKAAKKELNHCHSEKRYDLYIYFIRRKKLTYLTGIVLHCFEI
jgi:hypothetical protein